MAKKVLCLLNEKRLAVLWDIWGAELVDLAVYGKSVKDGIDWKEEISEKMSLLYNSVCRVEEIVSHRAEKSQDGERSNGFVWWNVSNYTDKQIAFWDSRAKAIIGKIRWDGFNWGESKYFYDLDEVRWLDGGLLEYIRWVVIEYVYGNKDLDQTCFVF